MNILYICKLYLWLTGGADFAETTRNVKFNQGNSVAKFTIPIIKDRIFEGTEVFTIQLAKHKSAKKLNIEICNPSTAIGHIIDKGEKINVLSMHILYIVSDINGCFWTKHSECKSVNPIRSVHSYVNDYLQPKGFISTKTSYTVIGTLNV